MMCSEINNDLNCRCFISKKTIKLGETCPFEDKTITMLNIEKNYKEQCGMTKKRFKEIISTQKVIDNKTGKKYDCLLDNNFYDLVNNLAEENKQLKRALKMEEEEAEVYNLDAMNYQNLYEQCKKENEQLQQENKELEDFRYGVFKSLSNFQEKMRNEQK